MSSDKVLQIINESGSLLIAFGIGIYAFRRMDAFFRLVFVQLSFWLLCYGLSYMVTFYQRKNGLELNNQWLMNLHLIGETVILLSAAFVRVIEKPAKVIIIIALVIFLMVVFYQLTTTGIERYFTAADVTECMIMTVLYSYLLYRAIVERNKNKQTSGVVLICIGLLIYFACSVPFIALLHVIQQRDPEANSFLFFVINDVVANLRYILMAVAFWLIARSNIHLKEKKYE